MCEEEEKRNCSAADLTFYMTRSFSLYAVAWKESKSATCTQVMHGLDHDLQLIMICRSAEGLLRISTLDKKALLYLHCKKVPTILLSNLPVKNCFH